MSVPDLVPARMVNEFAYCPRLFHLEWVQSRFADNDDTVEGRAQHRRVDQESGRVGDPRENAPFAARSVLLSSSELGLVARIDLVEADGTSVCPVDYKRGSPPSIPERAWEPERVQLCVQGILLREAGYHCDHGELWFAETRQRVRVEFDDALVARTLQLVLDLRAAADTDVTPPPLVDSPKCPRCSLVGLCLPDETNLLAERATLRPRRMVPKDDTARPLYVTQQGAHLGIDKGRVEIRRKGIRIQSLRLIDISQVNLYGNIQVSTQLLRRLFAREIPTCWFSYGGWFSGLAHGMPSKHVELRRRQVVVAAQGGLEIARSVVAAKIRNSRTMLRRNARADVTRQVDQLKVLSEQASEQTSVASLLGVEGAAARTYFGAFGAMLSSTGLPGGEFSFDGRNRRPPEDPVNCLLSFAYALLVKELTVTCLTIGFDPYMGFYHRPRFGRPALALDLAEEFRPLVAESVVLQVVNNGEVKNTDFVVRAGGVSLTRNGRRALITAHERRMATEITHPVFGYKVVYRRLLELQARLLGGYLLAEIPDYPAFTTR